MKTAISIPDEVFQEADRLARRLGKSRSQLYAEAVAEYVRRHDPDEVVRAIDAAVGRASGVERFVDRAAEQTLRAVDW